MAPEPKPSWWTAPQCPRDGFTACAQAHVAPEKPPPTYKPLSFALTQKGQQKKATKAA